ncbi:hypothetical protein HZS_1976, partial [Henneguya salminicola]
MHSDGVEEVPEPVVDTETAQFEADEAKFSESRQKCTKSTYQTEVSQLMRIIVNNLYRNKDVFLRELISNAFDALDKVRYSSLVNPSILDVNSEMRIQINVDPINRVISITDTGIGMTQEELSNNLGTIAKSGTKEFIKKLGDGNKTADLSSQIGQFGVGFYSVFLVADRVLVSSKSLDDSKQFIFEADTSSFRIFEDPRGDTLIRGTSVTLYLNQDSSEFLNVNRIVSLIKKYSEFILFPIYVYTNTDDDGKEVSYYWKHVNNISPIWKRPSNEVTEEEHEKFFNSISHGSSQNQFVKPIGIIEFSAEGETNFHALLYIPDKLDDEYVNSPLSWKPKIKLYVRRVLVTADSRPFVPHYLGFAIGIIDSEDLSLNVGREMPQHMELIKVIKKKITRKMLDYIKRMSQNEPEKYLKFYEEFGNALKFGIIDDETNSNRIARLLRFYSSVSTENKTTLDEYVSRMKPGQPGILFITAITIEDAKKSPYMERIRLKGYEILYMLDNIDEAIMQNLRVYENKAIYNIAKEISDIPNSKTEDQTLKDKETEFKPLVTWLKKTYFKGRISSARLSSRLLTSSCILMAPEQGYSGNMDRIIRSQAYVHGKTSGVDGVLNQAKNLELNPHHPLVKEMLGLAIEDPTSPELKEKADICFSIAALSGGYSVNDGVELAQLIERLYLK